MGNSGSGNRGASGDGWWNTSSNGHLPVTSDDMMTEETGEETNQCASDAERNESEIKTDDESIPCCSRRLSPDRVKELEEFNRQLSKKREVRKKILSERKEEMLMLRRQLDEERTLREAAINENKRLLVLIAQNNITIPLNVSEQTLQEINHDFTQTRLKEEIATLREQNKNIRCDLASCNVEVQSLTTEVAMLNKESTELKKHIQSLKDVNKVAKEMIQIRETQMQQLKDKLIEIEKSLADREVKMLSNDLRQEYERQLENMKNLRVLYEERARIAEVTRVNLVKDLEEQKIIASSQTKKCGDLEGRIEELEKEISDKNDMLGSTENQLGISNAEMKDLRADMTVINQLFSQILLGCNNSQDLDKLIVKLEENHDLLADLVVREDCSEVASALPRLILQLVNDVTDPPTQSEAASKTESSTENDASPPKTLTSAEEIVVNLPKVWKVLIELLSHQAGPQLTSDINDKSSNVCYKSVETPTGTLLVPSVSKTFIRLKDLILEKKALQRDMTRLKQLNSHLDNKLMDEERRLGLVSMELNKTWRIVGRMQRQYQQFHTQERILQFELQQKRVSLMKLKEELKSCREKWDMAKQKNSESEVEMVKLRSEFASRKLQSIDEVHNSPESGYSDEKASDDDSPDSASEKDSIEVNADSMTVDEGELENLKLNEELIDPVELPSDAECQYSGNSADTEEPLDEAVGINNTDSPETSQPNSRPSTSNTNYDEALAARSARLKHLEEQCYVLVHKVTKTNSKGIELCNRLEELHTQYGSTDQSTSADNRDECDGPINSNDCDPKEVQENPTEAGSSKPEKFDYEARFAARDARLQRLEEQAKSLVDKVSNTSTRGVEISQKLTDLHNTYGRSDEEASTSNADAAIPETEIPKPEPEDENDS